MTENRSQKSSTTIFLVLLGLWIVGALAIRLPVPGFVRSLFRVVEVEVPVETWLSATVKSLVVTAVLAAIFLSRVSGQGKLEQLVREAEGQAHREAGFPDFLRAQLRIVVARANLLMGKAEARANVLYRIGTLLAVVSVIAPVLAIAIYIRSDPLEPGLVSTLLRLRGVDGRFPSGLTISTAKEWHILLAGMSFGFLFLAASAALFVQHRRQTETLFLLAADVDHFNRVIAGVEIVEKSGTDLPTGDLARVAGMVVVDLLRRQPSAAIQQPSPSREESGASSEASLPEERFRQMLEFFKTPKE